MPENLDAAPLQPPEGGVPVNDDEIKTPDYSGLSIEAANDDARDIELQNLAARGVEDLRAELEQINAAIQAGRRGLDVRGDQLEKAIQLVDVRERIMHLRKQATEINQRVQQNGESLETAEPKMAEVEAQIRQAEAQERTLSSVGAAPSVSESPEIQMSAAETVIGQSNEAANDSGVTESVQDRAVGESVDDSMVETSAGAINASGQEVLDYSRLVVLNRALNNVTVSGNHDISAAQLTSWRNERAQLIGQLDSQISILEQRLANVSVADNRRIPAATITKWRNKLSELRLLRDRDVSSVPILEKPVTDMVDPDSGKSGEIGGVEEPLFRNSEQLANIQLHLPEGDEEVVSILGIKLSEYQGRLQNIRTLSEESSPQDRSGYFDTICKIAVIERLLAEQSVDAVGLRNDLFSQYGDEINSHLNNAFLVIAQYLQKDDSDLQGGTRLEKVKEQTLQEEERTARRLEFKRLQEEFAASKQAYYDALIEEYKTRSGVAKFVGWNRNRVQGQAKVAKERFEAADTALQERLRRDGRFERRAHLYNLLNKKGSDSALQELINEKSNQEVVDRQLEIQETHLRMPEKVQQVWSMISGQIKNTLIPTKVRKEWKAFAIENPKTAAFLGKAAITATISAAVVAFTSAAPLTVATGVTVGAAGRVSGRFVGQKAFVDTAERNQAESKASTIAALGDVSRTDYAAMRAEALRRAKSVKKAKKTKQRLGMAAGIVGGVAAGVSISDAQADWSSTGVPRGGLPLVDPTVPETNISPLEPSAVHESPTLPSTENEFAIPSDWTLDDVRMPEATDSSLSVAQDGLDYVGDGTQYGEESPSFAQPDRADISSHDGEARDRLADLHNNSHDGVAKDSLTDLLGMSSMDGQATDSIYPDVDNAPANDGGSVEYAVTEGDPTIFAGSEHGEMLVDQTDEFIHEQTDPRIEDLARDIQENPTYEVKRGDNIWKIIENKLDDYDLFQGMEEGQRLHLIDELKDKVAGMSTEELRAFGIESGDPNLIKPGENLHFDQLFEQDALTNAVEHADGLSEAQIDSIEAHAEERAAALREPVGGGETVFSPEELQAQALAEQQAREALEAAARQEAAPIATEAIKKDVHELFGAWGTEGTESIDWKDISSHTVKEVMEKTDFPVMDQWNNPIDDSLGMDSESAVRKMQAYINSITEATKIKPLPNETVADYLQRAVTEGIAQQKLAVGMTSEAMLQSAGGGVPPESAAMPAAPEYTPHESVVEAKELLATKEMTQTGMASQEIIDSEREYVHGFLERFQNEGEMSGIQKAQAFDQQYGYYPKLTETALAREFTVPTKGMTAEAFAKQLDVYMQHAYQNNEINLPAYRMYIVDHFGPHQNLNAVNAFVDRNAAEFADAGAALSEREALNLTTKQWQELGFSSGSPADIRGGDQIKIGKLMQHIMNNAAERINNPR